MLTEKQKQNVSMARGELDMDIPAAAASRLDRLVALVDHCTTAKDIAESMGETFLVYMLSMSIQAARTEMRPKILSGHP